MHALLQDIPLEMQHGDIQTRGIEWGGQLVRLLDLPPGVDFTPLFVGLPGDRCQCPHWGYVLKGSIQIRYDDGTAETVSAGELYYWPAGHTGSTEGGVTFVEFSPAHELQPVLEHLSAQLASVP